MERDCAAVGSDLERAECGVPGQLGVLKGLCSVRRLSPGAATRLPAVSPAAFVFLDAEWCGGVPTIPPPTPQNPVLPVPWGDVTA